MTVLWKRELQGYFLTPAGYVYIGVFLSVSGLLFHLSQLRSLSSDMTGFYSMLSYVQMLLAPVLVTRLIAGERKHFTDQLLYTSPQPVSSIVLAKYLAAFSVLAAALAFSVAYPALVGVYGEVWLPELAVTYLGLILQGGAFIAFDLMVTCFSKRESTASILAFGANLLLWLSSLAPGTALPVFLRSTMGFLSLYDRFVPFVYGQLSPANVVFYLGFIYLMLLATACILSRQRRGAAS